MSDRSREAAPSVPDGEERPHWIERLGYLLLVYGTFFGLYAVVNRTIDIADCRDLTTSLDRAVPLIPEFIYPFYLAYVLIPATAFVITRRRFLVAAAVAFTALVVASCAVFVCFPVHVPRPETLPESTAGWLLARAYAGDRPVCGFPSLHVSASVFAALLVRHQRPTLARPASVLASLTALALLFVRQHVIADLIGGLLFGWAAYRLYLIWPRLGRSI